MLSGLRRLINSTLGKIIAAAALILMAFLFTTSDIGKFTLGSTPGAQDVARVGDEGITQSDVVIRAKNAVQGAQAQNPGVTMKQFLDAGALDDLVSNLIDGATLDQFAQKLGLVVNDKQVDAKIASIPQFQGLNGKFDQKTYEQLLTSRGIKPDDFRKDVRRSLLARLLIDPVVGAHQVPRSLAAPYGRTLLEKRFGEALLIPVQAFGPGETPTEAEIQAFYRANAARYTIPERRVLRYALIDAAHLTGQKEPTEAEIAAAYKGAGIRYAPSETRTIEQVIVTDQAGAAALADKVRKGQSIKDAARAAGLEAATLTDTSLADYARQTNQSVASAVFAAKQGDVLTPAHLPFGWPVVRVGAIKKVPGKTLDQARGEIVLALKQQDAADALNTLQSQIDKGISGGSTFDQIAAEYKLTPQKTPALLNNGTDPDKPTEKPSDMQANLAKAAFDMQPNDPPLLVPMGSDGGFALVVLDHVAAAGPPPLAKIKDRVTIDVRVDKALVKARKAASDIVAAMGKGETLAQAIAKTGLKLPPPRSFAISRAELARFQGGQVPGPVRLLFTMKPKSAKLMQVEPGGPPGYFVVALNKVDLSDTSNLDQLVDNTQAALGTVIGRELLDQYLAAMKAEIGVKRNDAALKQVRDQLGGTSGN